jgi:drug/metabolite transporter (DMT)-like permease
MPLSMRAATALVALHVAVALFGFAALFGKWIALAPVEIVLGRTIVAALALGAVVRWRSQRVAPPNLGIVANGALLALHWIAFFAAVRVTSVAIALLGFASFPAFVLVVERALRGRRATVLELIAVALVVVGLALLVPELKWASRDVQGLAWGVAAGFTFAVLVIRNRDLVSAMGATPLALWQNGFAALWLLPIVVLSGPATMPTPRDIALVLLLGVFCTALAHTLFIASMRRLTAHTASVVSVLEPVYGIAWAALLLGEWPDARTLAGGALIVAAAALASSRSPLR